MIKITLIGNNRFLIRWKFQNTEVESIYEGNINDKTIGQVMFWIIDGYVNDLLSDNPENKDILEREREICKLEINYLISKL